MQQEREAAGGSAADITARKRHGTGTSVPRNHSHFSKNATVRFMCVQVREQGEGFWLFILLFVPNKVNIVRTR